MMRRVFLIAMLVVPDVLSIAGHDRAGGSDRVPPLTAAVITRDLTHLQALLRAGQDPNQKDDQGFSPWMWAIHFEENEALRLLLAGVPSIPAGDVAASGKLAVAASLNNDVAVRALIAKGVPSPQLVSGAEFSAGANLVRKNVKTQGTIFVPDDAKVVRAIIVLVESWPGAERGVYDATGRKLDNAEAARRMGSSDTLTAEPDLAVGRFRDQAWRSLARTCECALLHLRLGTIRREMSGGLARNGLVIRNGISNRLIRTAGEGGADALFSLLERLGDDSAHKELTNAPLVLWGWSATASFATTFAELYPERTVAFIRYPTHLRGLSPDLTVLKHIPGLLIAGGKDEVAGTEDAEKFWKRGRSTGAPWTFAIEPNGTHGSEETVVASHRLILPWIAAVVGQRLASVGEPLRPLSADRAWLGNHQTAEAAFNAMFSGVKNTASWLPDETTARGWQAVIGRTK
jgi:dienelactone hydrolase